MGDAFSKILIQTTVRKAIRDIRETPQRSTRNLIDMALSNATVLSCGQNKGKGYALKQAFSYCETHFAGEDIIVTADCDGQHSLSDVAAVCSADVIR